MKTPYNYTKWSDFKAFWLLIMLITIAGNGHAQVPCLSATTQTNAVNGVCFGCSITNPERAVDNSTSSFSILTNMSPQFGNTEQKLKLPVTGDAADSIKILLSFSGQISQVALISNVYVATYIGNTSNNNQVSITSSNVNLKLLEPNPNLPNLQFANITIKPGQAFDRVQVMIKPASGLQVEHVNIHNAYIVVPSPTVAAKSITLCGYGNNATLKATGPSGVTFKWYLQATGGVSAHTGSSYFLSDVNQSKSYYVESSKYGCANSNRTLVSVIVGDIPDMPVGKGDYICSGESATIYASSAGSAIRWYSQPTGGLTIGSSSPYTTAPLTYNKIYYAEAITRAGCKSRERCPVPVTILKEGQPIIKWSHGLANKNAIKPLITNDGYIVGINYNGNIELIKYDADGNQLWLRIYGGSQDDKIAYLTQAIDGGYIIAGTTKSSDGDITDGNNGEYDIFLLKVDNNGDQQWNKTFGGSKNEELVDFILTPDNNYLIGSNTLSNNGDITDGNNGASDYWLLKIDALGNKIWNKTFGGSNDDRLVKVSPAANGGYIVAGNSFSTNGDITDHKGEEDFWIVKTNNSGTKLWTKSLGGSDEEDLTNMITMPDGSSIFGGYTQSSNGDILNFHGVQDCFVAKLDQSGNKIWAKAYGGSDVEFPYSKSILLPTANGGFTMAAISSSDDGDINLPNSFEGLWIFKASSQGIITSSRIYASAVVTGDILNIPGGGLLVAVATRENGGDVTTPPHGPIFLFYDHWIFKTDQYGNIIWDGTYGSSYEDYASTIQTTPDGGILITGTGGAFDGDIEGPAGFSGAWIYKLKDDANCGNLRTAGHSSAYEASSTNDISNIAYPNPFSDKLTLKMDLEKDASVVIQIYNEQGVEIKKICGEYQKGNNEININTSELQRGIYLFKVAQNEKVSSLKVVKY
ncbi:T9SS type A sorting domain-containing protein [Sporocytophaga myxococcoides]|uniref:Ig-like domain-containing protein n=1 Tax=Sporocytophaga myxococcoides TaxID=153721 RepID=UPI0003F8CC21|nr:T9SS type A sorting domain-containing protein [Sporocytophaga myxococcoides]